MHLISFNLILISFDVFNGPVVFVPGVPAHFSTMTLHSLTGVAKIRQACPSMTTYSLHPGMSDVLLPTLKEIGRRAHSSKIFI